MDASYSNNIYTDSNWLAQSPVSTVKNVLILANTINSRSRESEKYFPTGDIFLIGNYRYLSSAMRILTHQIMLGVNKILHLKFYIKATN